jgi:hypothetical protein
VPARPATPCAKIMILQYCRETDSCCSSLVHQLTCRTQCAASDTSSSLAISSSCPVARDSCPPSTRASFRARNELKVTDQTVFPMCLALSAGVPLECSPCSPGQFPVRAPCVWLSGIFRSSLNDFSVLNVATNSNSQLRFTTARCDLGFARRLAPACGPSCSRWNGGRDLVLAAPSR